MARKNVITILSGCMLVCTVLFCTLNAHASGVTVKVKQFTISGSTGVAGVEMQGFPDGMKVETDQSGFYTAVVDYGKSFTIKPVKPGYNFTPASKPYTNVTKDFDNQDYTGKAITYIISGKVGDMADVVLEGLPGSPKTGADGSFSVEVEYDFTAQVTPVKEGFEFNPPVRDIASLKNNMTLSFTASPKMIKISGNAGTKDVEITVTGLPAKIVSGGDGTYTVTVPYNWSGTIAPKKEGFHFQPADTVFQNLTTDQTQDFGAEAEKFVISGTTGMANVKLQGLPGDVYSDSSGFYSVEVDYGFSQTVTPVLEGYTFEPLSTIYTKVTSNREKVDYKPRIQKYTIKGKTVIPGVTMTGLPGNPVTAGPDGSYSVEVEYGQSFTVIPEKEGYQFQPADRTYTVIAKDYDNDSYTATLKDITISGNAGIAGATLRGFIGKAVETDESGNYTATVKWGWKGKVTPSKNGYKFEPQFINYDNVIDNMSDQNYQATTIKYAISGTLISDKGKPVVGVTIYAQKGMSNVAEATTDAQGKYSIDVDFDWTGSIIPNPEMKGYTFQPKVIIYDEAKPVRANLANQNFKATIQTFKIFDVVEFAPGKPISGVQVTATPGDIKTMTNAKGEFTLEVPYGWTGEYTLFKEGIDFVPATKQFTDVTTNFNKGEAVIKPEGTTPSGGTPTGGTPTGSTPTGGTPTGRTPTGGTPTGGTPTGRTPTGGTPTGGTPTGGTPTGGTPTGGATKVDANQPVKPGETEEMRKLRAELDRIGQLVASGKTPGKTSPSGEPLVTEVYTAEDILTVLDDISSKTNIPIIYDDTVQGIVNCNLDQVPLSKALEMVLAGKPYFYKKVEGNPSYYLIAPAKPADPTSISIFTGITETKRIMLDNIPAALAKSMLATPFKEYVQADADPNGRMLTITAPASLMNRIFEDVKSMDLRQLQVLLEARIVVLEKGDLLNLGVQWGWPTIQSGIFSNNHHGMGSTALDFGGKSAWGIQIGYSPDVAFTNALEQVLNLLQVNNEAKILSKPVVFAQNNKMARIEVLAEDYYVLTPSNNNGFYTQTQFETIVTGTVLTITPHIGDENDIDLEMAVEVSNTIPNPSNSSFPRVLRRKAESSLRVYDGGTVAIAGLTEDRSMDTTQKVPFLGDIPVLGRLLFTNNQNEGSSKEIAIFVTASLVHETNPNGQDFTRRAPAAQSPMNNPLASYPSPGNSVEFNNMTQPTQPRTQSSLTSPNNQNQEPFLGFENNGPQNRRPQPAPARVSPKDEFNMQLNDSLGTQGRSQY